MHFVPETLGVWLYPNFQAKSTISHWCHVSIVALLSTRFWLHILVSHCFLATHFHVKKNRGMRMKRKHWKKFRNTLTAWTTSAIRSFSLVLRSWKYRMVCDSFWSENMQITIFPAKWTISKQCHVSIVLLFSTRFCLQVLHSYWYHAIHFHVKIVFGTKFIDSTSSLVTIILGRGKYGSEAVSTSWWNQKVRRRHGVGRWGKDTGRNFSGSRPQRQPQWQQPNPQHYPQNQVKCHECDRLGLFVLKCPHSLYGRST